MWSFHCRITFHEKSFDKKNNLDFFLLYLAEVMHIVGKKLTFFNLWYFPHKVVDWSNHFCKKVKKKPSIFITTDKEAFLTHY